MPSELRPIPIICRVMGLKSLFKGRKKASNPRSLSDGRVNTSAKVKNGKKSSQLSNEVSSKLHANQNISKNKTKNQTKKSNTKTKNKENGSSDRNQDLQVDPIPAVGTDNTSLDCAASSQFSGLSGMVHGSNVDIALMKSGKSVDVEPPKVIATMKRHTTAKQEMPATGREGALHNDDTEDTAYHMRGNGLSDQLSHLGVMDILQAGYSVLTCVAQCAPNDSSATVAGATAGPPVPKIIEPSANDDHSVGSLTLMTLEREERLRSKAATLCGKTNRQYEAASSVEAIAPPNNVADHVFLDAHYNDINQGEDSDTKIEGKSTAVPNHRDNIDLTQKRTGKEDEAKSNGENTKRMPHTHDKGSYVGRYGTVMAADEPGPGSDCGSVVGTIGRHFGTKSMSS